MTARNDPDLAKFSPEQYSPRDNEKKIYTGRSTPMKIQSSQGETSEEERKLKDSELQPVGPLPKSMLQIRSS